MLSNNLNNLGVEFVLNGHIDAILHMSNDHDGTHRRCQRIVRISIALILNEILRFTELADIVEI